MDMEKDLLAKMIERCRHGDPDAYSWMLGEYGPKLYHYFLRVTNSNEEAEDLLQDLFMKLLGKIEAYRHDGRFESWLFCVAANLVRDRFRHRKRRLRTVSLEAVGAGCVMSNPMTAAHDSPPQQLLKSEETDHLQQALNRLSDFDREIILLRHYGGLSFRKIAEHFDIPISTALARVHRGLKKLKKLMTEK